MQGGGSDLVFPHHEMSASEATVATGEPFAQAYVHAGMVALHGEKMSKSKGNLELVSRLRETGHDPMAIRLALLAHHYRSDWEWTDAEITLAPSSGWRRGAAAVARSNTPSGAELVERLRAALADDLDAPARAGRSSTLGRPAKDPTTSGAAQVRDAVDALLGVRL